MKTKIAIIIGAGIVVAASLCIAESGGSTPQPPSDLAALRAEVKQIQMQLDRVVTRTSSLEEQVRELQKSNAELQKMIGRFGEPHLTPLQTK